MNRKLLPHPGLLVDLIMGMLFPVCLGFRLMADPVHEWLGLALFVLFGVHLWFNRRWFCDLFRGRYTLRRALNAFVILALLGLMLMLLAGGLMNAHLLKALELPGSMEHRMRHTLAAYWGLVCVGLHTGMQWSALSGAIRKAAGRVWRHPAAGAMLRATGLALAVFGVWASFDREMGAKLFLGFGFDFWDPERPAALFYLCVLSIMSLYVWAGRGIARLSAIRRRKPPHE